MTHRRPGAEADAAAPGVATHRVAAYYDDNTRPFYLERWHPEDLHFGYFVAGADPRNRNAAVKAMTARAISPARILPGDRVLDAGCGVGGVSLDLARSGAHVLGVTLSPVQLVIARERAEAAGLSDLARFEIADCTTRLPCDDHSIDAVVTMEAVCHFEDKRGFLRECRRILKPGGRFAGTDWMAVEGIGPADHREYLDPLCEAWRCSPLATASQWTSMLTGAGFEVRDCTDLAETVMPNAKILARARLDLMLEIASGGHSADRARDWQQQFDTLMRAWFERRFTIGCFLAVSP